MTNSGTGTLKPANDPNFKDGTSKDDYEKNQDPVPSGSSTDDPLGFEAPRRPRPAEPDPGDDFSAPPRRDPAAPASGRTGTDSDIPFELDSDRINQKPPMPEASDLPAVEPEGGSTFLDEEKKVSDPQTRTMGPRKTLAERSSSLSEVLTPGRLASRSLPSSGSGRSTSWAGRSNGDKGQSVAPVRWISVPMPHGHARL